MSVKDSLYIFKKNYSELKKLLEYYSNLEKSLLQVASKPGADILLMLEATRLLHNFIASALSLRDCTRWVYKDICKSQKLLQEYQTKVDSTFTNNDLAKFIEDIRIYCQHYKTPIVYSQLLYSKDPPIFERNMKLDIKALEKFKNWNPQSKQFISKHTDGINLLELVHQYYDLVIEFHDWFRRQYMNIITNKESDY